MQTLKFDIKGMATLEADTAPVPPDQIETVISDLAYQAKLRSSDIT